MAPQKFPLDRSAAFTALLELDPDGFGKQDMKASEQTMSAFLEDWYASPSKDMYRFAREWLDERDDRALEIADQAGALTGEQLAEAGERYQKDGEIPAGWTSEGDPVYEERAEPEIPWPESLADQASGGDWQVTAQVHREADGWQSSRQVPAFTIPRWAAPAKGDAEAKAREIMNPYGERYDITMDVWSQDGPQGEPEADRAGVGPGDDPRQDLQAVADYYEGQTAGVRPLEKPSDIPGERQPGARQAERGE